MLTLDSKRLHFSSTSSAHDDVVTLCMVRLLNLHKYQLVRIQCGAGDTSGYQQYCSAAATSKCQGLERFQRFSACSPSSFNFNRASVNYCFVKVGGKLQYSNVLISATDILNYVM